ncbi:MAG TPA: GGDEF domain-containing protein [Candidatus Limnocylindria bacterium]|nr:GGDEF domain-containing protein [Candidatus Limnocylindria bacterium]
MNDLSAQPGAIIAFAAIAPLLLLMLYVFRALPWTRSGPWRIVIALVALASIMFITAQGAVLAEGGVGGTDPLHQLPLFFAMLAAAAAAMTAHLEGARAAERARLLSLTDPLTGLRNRRAFEESLKVAYEEGTPFSVVFVDLDGFKAVNDRLGHEAGDNALQHAAGALLRAVRQADTAARLGGDEFGLLLLNADAPSAQHIAERALEEMRAVTTEHPEWAPLSASLGIATSSDAATAAALLDRADKAMYSAKRAGGDRIALAEAV